MYRLPFVECKTSVFQVDVSVPGVGVRAATRAEDEGGHRVGSRCEGPNQHVERTTAMAVTTMELMELLRKADGADVDFLREGVRVLAQALMDAEVSAQIGAEHSQRNTARTTHRNGYRGRDWDTRVGTIDLQIP